MQAPERDDGEDPGSGGGRGARGAQLRRHNLAVLLEHLHLSGATSRSQLATLTGLNRSTIGGLIDELGALGFVEESGSQTGPGPGRPSSIVHPRPDGATVLAIDLAVDSFAIASVGLGGSLLGDRRFATTEAMSDPRSAVSRIARTARTLLDDLPPNPVVGIGIAVAGLVRRTDGFVHLAPNLGWNDVPLAPLVVEAFSEHGVPTPATPLIANEADLGALAEHRRGVGRGIGDVVFVSGEVGIGVGVIAAGRPLLGAAGYAGEAGHMLVDPNGRRCGCGARGCWETVAGEPALLRRAGLSPAARGPRAVADIVLRAGEGDEVASTALREVGWWLGLGAGDLVKLLNPQLLVLGGLYHRLMPDIEQAIRDGLASRALGPAESLVDIRASELGEDGRLVGAAELAFAQLIADPAARRVNTTAGDGRAVVS